MIKRFTHKGLEKFFRTGSRRGIDPAHAKRLQLQLTALDQARGPDDMNAPNWRLHSLGAKLKGFYAVSINGNWRLIFRFDGANATDVEYQDYH